MTKGNFAIHTQLYIGGCEYIKIFERVKSAHANIGICTCEHAHSSKLSGRCVKFRSPPRLFLNFRDRVGMTRIHNESCALPLLPVGSSELLFGRRNGNSNVVTAKNEALFTGQAAVYIPVVCHVVPLLLHCLFVCFSPHKNPGKPKIQTSQTLKFRHPSPEVCRHF